MSEYVTNRIYICIDAYGKVEMSGRLYHTKLPDEYLFTDSNQLMLCIESVLDAVNYPEPSTKTRTFHVVDTAEDAQKPLPLSDEGTEAAQLNARGELATFVVHTQYRQNTSWQGSMLWVEKAREQFFRSELELLKLIDSALTPEGV